MSDKRHLLTRYPLFIILVLALVLRLIILACNAVPFNSDEAVLALMAQRDHLLDPFRGGWYTSACLPGMKLAVHSDGSLHICERINSSFPIGDCWTGLDFGKIKSLMRQYHEQVVVKCNQCVSQRFCQICWATAAQDGKFGTGTMCQEAEQLLPSNLSVLCSILEENPCAFDDFVRPFDTNPYFWG